MTRAKWFKINGKEGHSCFYCGKYLAYNELTLDHYHPRGSHPELRYELSNLRPCCYECNGKKGSIDGDKFMLRGDRDD